MRLVINYSLNAQTSATEFVNSRTAILGAETSPRRTRLGKIVKYKAE
jgi:hypothetical protein